MPEEQVNTLIELLEYRAGAHPDRTAFTFNDTPYTYQEMWAAINRYAAYLQSLGVSRGDRVVMALPNGPDFFTAFYGVQRAGGVAVPLFPGSKPGRFFSIAALCGARLVITADPESAPSESNQTDETTQGPIRSTTVAAADGHPGAGDFPELQPHDLAFLQYTSGSTGNPKGVQLSHFNLLSNLRSMIAGMEISGQDVFVSWLPVYHDLGLIILTMMPFYLGTTVHLLPTSLREVQPWLNAIERHRGTFTAAPDFAYRLCLRYVDPSGFDLSSLRIAMNAAEPVRASTIQAFEEAFRVPGVMRPAYGLAEATVGVSMLPPGHPLKVDPRGFVTAGLPFPGIKVRIVENGKTLPPGEVGEIAVYGPSLTSGYFENPVETEKLFLKDGYMLTGDLGYLDEHGYLFIISRKKNIIKLFGETISPQEVEEIVDSVQAVRYSAAVGVDKDRLEGEQVYVFAEIRGSEEKAEADFFDLSIQIVQRIHRHMGFRPGRVYLLKPRAIPLTHNGKIQHQRLRERYLGGELRKSGGILYPGY